MAWCTFVILMVVCGIEFASSGKPEAVEKMTRKAAALRSEVFGKMDEVDDSTGELKFQKDRFSYEPVGLKKEGVSENDKKAKLKVVDLETLEEANHIIPVPQIKEAGSVISFNYRLSPKLLWKEESRVNDWVYSSWQPEYTVNYRWMCPREPAIGGMKRVGTCKTIGQLKYYNQGKEILIDTYDIGYVESYDLRDVDTNLYIVPEKLSEKDIEVSVVMVGKCVRLNYKINSNLEVNTTSKDVDCSTVGYAEIDTKKQHKWNWNTYPDDTLEKSVKKE